MQTNTQELNTENSKYFLFIAIAYVSVLLISNTVASKIIQLGPLFLAGATFIFPISYIFGDVLTEVYGYKATRKIIWSGFIAIICMSLAYFLIGLLPAAPFWNNQNSYDIILGVVPRIALAGIAAYFFGEFCNSYIMSKMKIYSNGKNLWMRTIGSTLVGEGIDSFIFGFIAFYATMPDADLLQLILSIYLVKVIVEIIFTPVTYFVINKLKKLERIDVYDKNVDHNPFSIK